MERHTSDRNEFILTIHGISSTAKRRRNPPFLNRRQIHRVLPQLRLTNRHMYDPVMVSLGPYHHGKPDLQVAEGYKHKVLEMFVSDSGKDREFFYNALFEMVGEIRSCYVGVCTKDGALAEMMLLDACFVINLMEIVRGNTENYNHFCCHLGMVALPFLCQDLFFLENQIPLYVIKLLISMRYGGDEGHRLLYQYLSITSFGDERVTFIPGEDENQPLHLLEAYHRLHFNSSINDESKEPHIVSIFRHLGLKRKGDIASFSKYSQPFRSVTSLKERGINFRPSSYLLNDIRFTSYTCCGVLHLPIWVVTNNSRAFFSNVIAYEMSPENDAITDLQATSYVNFMKSLLEKPEDVKELREKKILFSTLGSNEEIVKIFKEINTFGEDNAYIFNDVKFRLGQHCSSRAKTWTAELVHTYFRSPWTTIALLAATFLLCLTFLQTYYTMNPVSSSGHKS